MMYDHVKEQLKFVTGSEPRARALLSLSDGPKAVKRLVETTQTDKSTILHYIAKLIKEGMVSRDENSVYSLTGTGQLNAALLDSMVRGLAAIQENTRFWQMHDLRGIPANLQADIGKLAGCTCICDGPTDLLRSQAYFIEHVSQARRIWGVSPIIAPGYVDMITGLLEGGATVDLVLTTEIIGKISPEVIESWRASGRFTLYEIADAKAAFVVTERCLFLGMFLHNGMYDKDQDLVCDGPGAVDWGMELFEYYRGLAAVVL